MSEISDRQWIVGFRTFIEDHFSYFICPHREKYLFKTDSLLLRYLHSECQGWVRDVDDKYTVNYILIVLFANFKAKQLFNKQYPCLVQCKGNLQFVFNRRLAHINELRALVLSHLQQAEPYIMLHEPFLCPIGFTTLINTLHPSVPITDLCSFNCKTF